jgi:hypothetical protein
MAMRPAQLLLAAALLPAFAWPARGESAPSQATVSTDGAEVRCKPGTDPSVYVTHRLNRGDTVQVVEKAADGWLKIVPPPGSFSWVNTRVLSRGAGQQPVWTVSVLDGVKVPVLVGSPFKPGKPDVVGTRLTRGAQVVAVGDAHPAEDGDGLWLPIMPPPGDYRYIRDKDVTLGSASPGAEATATNTTAHAGTAGQLADQAAVKPGPAAAPPTDVRVGVPAPAEAPRAPAPAPANTPDALYLQARQYEAAGNWAEASRSYARLADYYRDNDYQLSLRYYNHASRLKQVPPGTPPVPTTADTRLVPVAAGAPAPAQTGAMSVQMAGPGRLQHSNCWIDGRATYVLESAQGQVLAYLAPQSGVDLEHFVGQNVEALGQIVPRADVRGQYMTVARVRPLTAQ